MGPTSSLGPWLHTLCLCFVTTSARVALYPISTACDTFAAAAVINSYAMMNELPPPPLFVSRRRRPSECQHHHHAARETAIEGAMRFFQRAVLRRPPADRPTEAVATISH